MAVSQDYLDYVMDQLSPFGNVETKKMFGGISFFMEGTMFAMIGFGAFRMRVDENNQQDYEEYGMEPVYGADKKIGMPYWEVPVEILEDSDQLKEWASRALDAAIRGKKRKKHK